MELKNQEQLGVARVREQEKHLEILSALNTLDRELDKTRDFVSDLLGEGRTPEVAEKVKEPEAPFMSVYSGIVGRVDAVTHQLSEITQQLRNMLLG